MRSETQATDSSRSGCRANNPATNKLRHFAPVIRCSTAKTSAALSACNTTLVKWCPHGFTPHTWQTSMWDKIVKGCQLSATGFTHAHLKLSQVNPP